MWRNERGVKLKRKDMIIAVLATYATTFHDAFLTKLLTQLNLIFTEIVIVFMRSAEW